MMELKGKFRFRSLINCPAEDVFSWHLRDHVVKRSLPPWGKAELVSEEGKPNKIGSKIVVKERLFGPFSDKVELEYVEFVPNESFKAIQTSGFFTHYSYEGTVVPQSQHTCEIIDQLEFSYKKSKISSFLINRFFAKKLVRMIGYKHSILKQDLCLLEKYPFQTPLKILITGSHGMIGTNLLHFLELAGHDLWRLSRSSKDQEPQNFVWDPDSAQIDIEQLEGFDIVVNLAGENLLKGRWTKNKKERILKSRYQGTQNLVELLKKLKKPPKTFISASSVGYYGDTGSELVNENSGPGKGLFISEVCEHWERASKDLEEVGTRVIQARFGMVLSSAGGGLKTFLRSFKCGLGGKLGSGNQYVNWITIDDVIGSLYHIMMTPSIKGPVNVVAPYPLPNRVFCTKIAKRLKRWMGPPMPEFLLRILMQQKGEELFLTSIRAEPSRLIETGYTFFYPTLTQALEHIV